MFEPNEMEGKPYPGTEEEVDQLISNVINMVHSEEIRNKAVKTLQTNQGKVVEVIAQLSAISTVMIVKAIEQNVQRDITPDTELALLAIVVEEFYTIAANLGKKVSEEEVANSVQIAGPMYNKILEGGDKPQGMIQGRQGGQQGQPQQGQQVQQGQPQGQPQGMIQGERGGLA